MTFSYPRLPGIMLLGLIFIFSIVASEPVYTHVYFFFIEGHSRCGWPPRDQKGTWYVQDIHKVTHFCNLNTSKPFLLLNLKLRFLTMCIILLLALIFANFSDSLKET